MKYNSQELQHNLSSLYNLDITINGNHDHNYFSVTIPVDENKNGIPLEVISLELINKASSVYKKITAYLKENGIIPEDFLPNENNHVFLCSGEMAEKCGYKEFILSAFYPKTDNLEFVVSFEGGDNVFKFPTRV